jgi:hypothetical protein
MEMKTKLLITGLVLMALTTMVEAQNSGTVKKQQNVTGNGTAYVDANNDGICDNYGTNRSNARTGRGNGNCIGCGQGLGQKQGQRQGQGQGQGRGQQMGQCGRVQGQGQKMNFVDADKNGICDKRETAVKK